MITEDYVSFEVAKLLKEKGFDEECRAYWDSRIDDLPKEYEIIRFTEEPIHQPYDNMHSIRKRYLAPTHQVVMKWLREVHNVYIDISIYVITENILKYNINVYYKKHKNDSMYLGIHLTKECSKYEEAVEVALKYSLENLI